MRHLLSHTRNEFLIGFLMLITGWAGSVSLNTYAADLPDFTELVEKYSPAVVNVSTVQHTNSKQGASPDMDELFRRFFPDGQNPFPRSSPFRERRSLGSGFIISEDGYILTNNHVVDHADEVVVRLNDRRELEAKVIGTDPRSDVALVKVDAKDLPTVKIGHSDNLKVGEWVLAIGSPFGFDYSVTAGIVSARGRSLPSETGDNYVPFIQTDVAINPGNSGGPLFNLKGEVVGINSQIYTRSGGFMGVSFAIPIDVAMEVANQLREAGKVSRGWLGVVIQEVNRDLAESFGLDKPHGALVTRVLEGGPADKAGVKVGDVILSFNDEEIQLSADLPHVVGRTRPGSKARMLVMRAGKRITLNVKVGELADLEGGQTLAATGGIQSESSLGLSLEPLSEAAKQQAGVKNGLRVIDAQGPAAEAGIVRGDIIVRLNNKVVDSLDSFLEISRELEPGTSVPVLIVRGQNPTFLALKVPTKK